MQAIEFITTKTKNSSIDIPQEFADKVSGQFRVILLLNQPNTQEQSYQNSPKPEFNTLKVELKGLYVKKEKKED